MMKKVPLLLLVLFSCLIHGQNDVIENRKKLPVTGHPENNFYVQLDICTYYYQTGNSDSMFIHAKDLLRIAQVSTNDSFLIASYKILGNCSRLKSDYITAIEYYFTAVHLAEKSKNVTGLLAILYNNIGDNYNKLGYYEEALKYLKKADQTILISGNNLPKYSVYIYTNLAETFLWLDQPDSSLYYLDLANKTNLVSKDNYIKSAILLAYGMTYNKSNKDTSIVEDYFMKAILFSDSMQDYKHLANSFTAYGKFLLAGKKYEDAKRNALNSLEISKKYNYKENIIDNSDLLSKIYDEQNRTDSAFYFSRLKNDYSDSVFNIQKQNQLLSMTFNEQIREKEEEVRKQEEEHQRKINIQYSLIAIAIVTFIILFLLLSQSVNVNTRVIIFLGEIGLLISFEFINLVIHPFIERVAHHTPVFILLILVIIASLLVPMHHYLQEFVRHKLAVKREKIKIEEEKRISMEMETKPGEQNN